MISAETWTWLATHDTPRDVVNDIIAHEAGVNIAIPVNAIVITTVHKLDGTTVLETSCADFDAWQKLPQVVSYQGIICGKTGWSSDTGQACYKSTATIANIINPKGSR